MITETQYYTIKQALDKAKTPIQKRQVTHIASEVGVYQELYNKMRVKILTTKDYTAFCALFKPKSNRREEVRLRRETAIINKATMPKQKLPFCKTKEKGKAGQTTRALKAISEDAQKEQALKEYTQNLNSELNAKDEFNLSVYICITVDRDSYRVERAKYNTQEKIDNFIALKRKKEQDRINSINEKLRKTPNIER